GDETKDQLARAQQRIKKLVPLADLVPILRADIKSYKEKLSTEQALTKLLQTDLERSVQTLTAAGKDMKDLQATREKAATEAKTYKDQLTRAEDKLRTLDQEMNARVKELTTAERIIESLQGEKKTLAAEAERVRLAVENRFEGIALTGRRVIFLVDMSGS